MRPNVWYARYLMLNIAYALMIDSWVSNPGWCWYPIWLVAGSSFVAECARNFRWKTLMEIGEQWEY